MNNSLSLRNRVVRLGLRTTHPWLTLDGLENVLDRELQRSEAVRNLIGSRLVLLRVQGWLLLESALPVTLDVNRGASVLWLQFCPVIAAVEILVSGAFHCLLKLDV